MILVFLPLQHWSAVFGTGGMWIRCQRWFLPKFSMRMQNFAFDVTLEEVTQVRSQGIAFGRVAEVTL